MIFFFFISLSLDGADTSLGLSENGIALRVASAGTETDTQPHGPSTASEEQNGGDDTETETKSGLD